MYLNLKKKEIKSLLYRHEIEGREGKYGMKQENKTGTRNREQRGRGRGAADSFSHEPSRYICLLKLCADVSMPPGLFPQGEGGGEGCKVRETKLTLPQGMVMAYKTKQLVFKEEGWGKRRLTRAGAEGSAPPEK